MRPGSFARVVVSLALVACAGTSSAQTLSSVLPSNSSSPLDAFEGSGSVIPALAKFDTLSSVSVTSSTGTEFTTRYISTNTTDSEFLQPAWVQTLTSDYTISFTVTAPALYELTVDTSLIGDLCLDDDNIFPPAGNFAEIFDVSGSQTGGTVDSGSLDLTFSGGSLRIDDTGGSFDPITTPFNVSDQATITGASFGVPQVHTLSFSWTQVSSTPGNGDPSTIRIGQDARLGASDACTYAVPPRAQAPDGHWVTVSVAAGTGCGDSVVDPGEGCDEGANNGAPGSCCDGSCQLIPAGMVCRSTSAGDVCDVAETCDGVSPTCPADGVEPAGTVCNASIDDCDAEETCDGVAKTCPADGVEPAGTVCRAAADTCDAVETCDGISTACPADGVESAGTECRAAAGVCDTAETCDGIATSCPADGFEPATTECRSVAGVCDVAENCTGSGASCPADAFDSGSVCRADSGECDVEEVCDGASADCPADAFEPDGTSCTDDGEFCTGEESCLSGVCTSEGDPCAPAICDEGSAMCLLTDCPLTPATGCLTSQKSILLYKDKTPDTRDKLIYKWIKGQATTQAALSDPLTTAGYDLCLYAGTTAALILQAQVEPSATKWKAISTKGYRYKDNTLSEDGTQRIVLKANSQDRSKALWKGKGVNLPDDLSGALPIPEFPVVVQLFNDQGSICMESTFSAADVKKNEADQLKLKNP